MFKRNRLIELSVWMCEGSYCVLYSVMIFVIRTFNPSGPECYACISSVVVVIVWALQKMRTSGCLIRCSLHYNNEMQGGLGYHKRLCCFKDSSNTFVKSVSLSFHPTCHSQHCTHCVKYIYWLTSKHNIFWGHLAQEEILRNLCTGKLMWETWLIHITAFWASPYIPWL